MRSSGDTNQLERSFQQKNNFEEIIVNSKLYFLRKQNNIVDIKVLIIISLVIFSVLFVLSFFVGEENIKYCQVDDDCVPMACCHPDDCVNLANRPDCTGIMCTMECKPGTMDCGQGYCACVDNECRAMIE